MTPRHEIAADRPNAAPGTCKHDRSQISRVAPKINHCGCRDREEGDKQEPDRTRWVDAQRAESSTIKKCILEVTHPIGEMAQHHAINSGDSDCQCAEDDEWHRYGQQQSPSRTAGMAVSTF